MEFNIQKYLIENKLTGQSRMREDDNTELTLHTGDESDDFEEEEPEDSWNKPEPDDSAEFEKEPQTKDIAKSERSLPKTHIQQAKLQALEKIKDQQVSDWVSKSSGLSRDSSEYKAVIGDYQKSVSKYQPKPEEQRLLGKGPINIPKEIIKLRADIEDDSDEDI